MSHQLIFPKVTWCEFLLILDFLSVKDRLSCGSVSKSAFVHISTREKNLFYSIKSKTNVSRFLPNNYRRERILLVSYPRCGNSLLRQLIEKQTGIATGSDSRSNRPLAASLIRCGFKGEGIIDSSVWIVKTHYPERMGYVKCKGDRVILLVRNPFDALESYFHMGMTNTHDKSLTDGAFQSVYAIWEEFILNEAKVWNDFYLHWLSVADSAQVPTLVLRYEDLATNSKESMSQVMRFLQSGRVPGPYTSATDKSCDKRRKYYKNLVDKHCYCKSNAYTTSTTPSYSGDNCSNSSNCNINTNCSENNISNNNTSNVVGVVEHKIGYKPKKGGIGKGLKRMNATSVDVVCRDSKECMELFGYNLSSSTMTSITTAEKEISLISVTNADTNTAIVSTPSYSSVQLSPSSSSSSTTTTTTAEAVLTVTPLSTQLLHTRSQVISKLHNYNDTNNTNDINAYVPSSYISVVNINDPTTNNDINQNTNNSSRNRDNIASSTSSNGVWINEASFSIRSENDRFGRNFTYTRQDITCDDTQPLPTIS